MPEPVSTLGVCCVAGYTALNVYARGRSAISSEARDAQKAATAVVESVERSQALFGKKAAALSQLSALANECAQPGWDGDEADPMDPIAVLRVQFFIRALPNDVPLPEFAPEPDGNISLDWIQSRNRFFTLSVGPGSRLAYAWLDGTDKGHGVAQFDGQTIPSRILGGIQALLTNGNASLRAA